MNSARYTGAVGKDNTGRNFKRDYQAIAYAATIALAVKNLCALTIFSIAALSGVSTLSINVGDTTTPPMIGDEVTILIAGGGADRVVTFGTGFVATGTISVTAAKFACIRFIFNGASWQEISRAVTV